MSGLGLCASRRPPGSCTSVIQLEASLIAEATFPGVGELTALLPSWRLHLKASRLFPHTIRVLAGLPDHQGVCQQPS